MWILCTGRKSVASPRRCWLEGDKQRENSQSKNVIKSADTREDQDWLRTYKVSIAQEPCSGIWKDNFGAASFSICSCGWIKISVSQQSLRNRNGLLWSRLLVVPACGQRRNTFCHSVTRRQYYLREDKNIMRCSERKHGRGAVGLWSAN